jgi:hypothetical protein
MSHDRLPLCDLRELLSRRNQTYPSRPEDDSESEFGTVLFVSEGGEPVRKALNYGAESVGPPLFKGQRVSR